MEITEDQIDRYEAWLLRKTNKEEKKGVLEDYDPAQFYQLYQADNIPARVKARLSRREVTWTEQLLFLNWLTNKAGRFNVPGIPLFGKRTRKLVTIVDSIDMFSVMPFDCSLSYRTIHLDQARTPQLRRVSQFLSEWFCLYRMEKYISHLQFRTGSDQVMVAGEEGPGKMFKITRDIGNCHTSAIQVLLLLDVYWRYKLVPTGPTVRDSVFEYRGEVLPKELELLNQQFIYDIAIVVAGFSDYLTCNQLVFSKVEAGVLTTYVVHGHFQVNHVEGGTGVDATNLLDSLLKLNLRPDGTMGNEVVADHHAQGSVPRSDVVD